MSNKLIKEIIIHVLNLPEAIITDIRPTPGGVTNKSYFATVNDQKYVIRIPGAGTDKLINRHAEKANLEYATALGINPAFVYCDAESGLKITPKINNAVSMTPNLAREETMLKQIIYLFKHLHTAPTSMENDFKLFDLMDYYETLINEVSDVIMEELTELRQDVMSLKAIYESLHITAVPCHADPVTENLIIDKDANLYLIDWEYSGMFDPLWDIATLILSLNLEKEETLFFLTTYLQRKPSNEELQRILMHTIFQDYLWCLWAHFKVAEGDNLGADAVIRSVRAKENLTAYWKLFEEETFEVL